MRGLSPDRTTDRRTRTGTHPSTYRRHRLSLSMLGITRTS
jgi:hypothetical protein